MILFTALFSMFFTYFRYMYVPLDKLGSSRINMTSKYET